MPVVSRLLRLAATLLLALGLLIAPRMAEADEPRRPTDGGLAGPASPPPASPADDEEEADEDESDDEEGDEPKTAPEADDEDGDEDPLSPAAARRELDRGRYDDVLEIAEEIEDDDGFTADDRCHAAAFAIEALTVTGRYEEAIERAKAILAETGDEAPGAKALAHVGLRLARAYRRTGAYADAKAALEAATERSPTDRAVRIELAQLLLHDLGEREESKKLFVSFFDHYQSADSLTADDLYWTGLACLGLDLFPEVKEEYSKPMYRYAQRMFDEAIEEDRKHADTRVVYGRIYNEKFDYPSAKKRYEEALAINPDHADGRTGLAETTLASVYGGRGRFEEARRELDRALRINPKHASAIALDAFIHFTDDAFSDALDRAEEALQINPNHISARAVRAAVYFCQGDDEGFEEEKKAVFATNPKAARFYVEVARHVVMKFKYHGALELAKKAIEVDADYWPAYAELGLNFGRTGDEEKAYEYLDRAFQNDPFNIYAKNQLDVLDRLKEDYVTEENEHFVLRVHKDEAPAIKAYLMDLLMQAREELGAKYEHEVDGPVLVELFPRIEHFSARTIGLPFIGALGACFGKVVTLLSPRETRVGTHNWGRTTWHEFAHVVTLQKSGHRVPRWFTEGLSVYEEDRGRTGWGRGETDKMILTALGQGRLMRMKNLNNGFTKPSGGAQIMLAYNQGGMVCEFIAQTFGFEKLPAMLLAYKEGLDTEGVFQKVLETDFDTFDEGFLAWLRDRFANYRFRAPATRTQLRALAKKAKKSPGDAELYAKLAFAYLDHGKRSDADIWSNRALKVDEKQADAWLVRGLIALRKKNLEGAMERITKALEIGTSDPVTAHRALAHIYGKKSDAKKALEHIVAARDLFPRDVAIHKRLIKAAEAAGADEIAREAREMVIKLDPADIETRVELSKMWMAEGENEKLARAMEDVIFINPFVPDVHYMLGEALIALQKKPAQAEREFEMAIALEYGDVDACHLGIAKAAIARGDKDKAAKFAQKVLQFDPANEDAQAILKEAGGPRPDDDGDDDEDDDDEGDED